MIPPMRSRARPINSQQTPVQVLELPISPDPCNLEHHDSIVRQQVVQLSEEFAVFADPDVLGHFEA